MVGGRTVSQQYERHTNVLVTRYEDDRGTAMEVVDFMPRYTWDGRAGARRDVDHAKFFELCSQNRGLNVHAFTSFEELFDWLSQPSEISSEL
jgi:hypothetical protein